MAESNSWIFRVLRLITREEVKTPLAFLFRVVAWLIAAILIVLYAPIADESKISIVHFVFYSLLGLAAVVLVFAWCKPKNLVYGESGHRAEYKIEYGTESKPIHKEELEVLPPGSDPKLPQLEQK